jgi:acetyl esterase/lipase
MKRRIRFRALFVFSLLGLASVASAAEPEVIPLWPGAAPGSENLMIEEKITERSADPARHDRIYTQIVTPSLAVHRPAQPNGVAVIVAPGGGYQRVVVDKEGSDTAAWLNRLGVTAFVLKYRLPGEGHANGHNVPLMDAQRAVRLVRARAAEFGADPARIGFLGYSAGGHLAMSVTFFHDRKLREPSDAIDAVSARPDFVVLCYAAASRSGEPPVVLDTLTPNERIR